MMKFQILVALLAVAPLVAQPPGGGRGNRVDFLAGYLSLTDAQKTAAKAIFDDAATASTTQQGRVAAAHDALEAGIKAGTSDAQIDTLAAALGVAEGGMRAIQAKADVKFRALLTPDQKTKLDAAPGGGGPGRRGPGGPGPLGVGVARQNRANRTN